MAIQIRQNPSLSQTELWVDNEFYAGWSMVELSSAELNRMEYMMREVWRLAMKSKDSTLREAIEQALRRTA